MIDCSFTQDYQRRYTLGTGTQPNHYFRWEFSSLFNATFFIGISTIYWSHSMLLRVIDIIDVKELFIQKENSHGVLFSKICSNPICKFFSVWSFEHWKAMVRLLSYRNVALNRFLLFVEYFSRKHQAPSIIFELIFFSLGVSGVLPFEYCPSFLRNVDHLVDLTVW